MVALKDVLLPPGGGVVALVGAGGKTSLMFRLAQEVSAAGQAVLTTTTTKIYIPRADQSRHLILYESPEDAILSARQLLKTARHVSAASRKIVSQNKLAGYSPKAIEKFLESGLFKWIIVEADGSRQKPIKAPGPQEPVIPACSRVVVGLVGLGGVGKPLGEDWVFRPEVFAEITGLAEKQPIDEAAVALSIAHERGILKGSPAGAVKVVFLNQAELPGCLETAKNICSILSGHQPQFLDRIVAGSLMNGTASSLYLRQP